MRGRILAGAATLLTPEVQSRFVEKLSRAKDLAHDYLEAPPAPVAVTRSKIARRTDSRISSALHADADAV